VSGSWKGSVYVGGIILRPDGAVGGVLLDDALALWAQSHGGSRVIPGVAGFHVHPYLNFMASNCGSPASSGNTGVMSENLV